MKPSRSSLLLLEKMALNKRGSSKGMYSVCSANKYVLMASMEKAKEEGSSLLIEATCNQVNQFGGYTGMNPEGFVAYIHSIAAEKEFPVERLILGGDHLGPYPWIDKPAAIAMDNSIQMVKDYANAGFQKIHIDASMFCGDDDRSRPMSKELSAERASLLCSALERTTGESSGNPLPIYVIGTEVPLPGGQQEVSEEVQVTSVNDVRETLSIFQYQFKKDGLAAVWERVIAVVVQPGVEFGENEIVEYKPDQAIHLKQFIETVTGIVYEAHSTDYQTRSNLRKMVEDHFAILKVGPALTFAFREAVIGLHHIEDELFGSKPDILKSDLVNIIKRGMDAHPENWAKYLQGSDEIEVMKIFGYSDRIRYYWNLPEIRSSLQILMKNLRQKDIPLSLISQYLPDQYEHVREGLLEKDPEDLIIDRIKDTLSDYSFACS